MTAYEQGLAVGRAEGDSKVRKLLRQLKLLQDQIDALLQWALQR
jgi:hypothetical protein